MIPLLLCLLPAMAGTLTEAEDAAWQTPLDPAARLAFAEALAASPGREEEGAEALRWLLGAPVEGPIAREVLGEIVRKHPPRRGWSGLYAELLAGPPGLARDAARVRAAQLASIGTNSTQRARGYAELRALSAEGEALADVALGDLLLEAGDPAAARIAWLRAPLAFGAQRVALAALLLGEPEEAERERIRALDAGVPREAGLGEAFTIAVTTNSPVSVARTLLEGGFPQAAERVAAAALAKRGGTGAAAAVFLGDLRLARGDSRGAATAYAEAMALDASPETRAGLVRALLLGGKVPEAIALLATGDLPDADRTALETTLVFVRARATPSPDDDLPAAAAAFAAAPDEAGTAAAYGRLLLAAGRDADAVAPLAHATGLHPTDLDLRARLIDAALRANDARALDVTAAALAYAPSDTARATQLDTLAHLLLTSATAQQAAGSRATARLSALVALAVRPGSVHVLHSAAALLWRDGEHAAALSLYQRAAEIDPEDLDAKICAVQLAHALGRAAEADAWLAALPPDEPKVRALRDELTRETQARAARALTDPVAAEGVWKGLIAQWPRDARFLHGLADVYQRLGRLDEALGIQRAAAKLGPDDPWNQLGVIQALLALGRKEEAIQKLDALPSVVSADLARERDRIRARLEREEGDRARAGGDLAAGLLHYQAAYALDPDIWTSIALGGTLVAAGEPAQGLAHFRAALASHGDDPDVDAVASRGEAGALEAMGETPAAMAVLDALAARRPDPDTHQQREEMQARVAVVKADALRRAGKLSEAEAALQELAVEVGNQPMVQAAYAALLYDRRRPQEAVVAATRALQREPKNQWALDVARMAGRACRCSDRVVPLFRVAIASGGPPTLAAELQQVRVSAATEAALKLRKQGRGIAARDAMREAAAAARNHAPSLVLLAEGARAFGWPRRARATLERAHALDPANVEATLALADDLRARGKWRAAVAMMDAAWATGRDARVGTALAQLRANPPMAWHGAATVAAAPGVAAPPSSAALDDPALAPARPRGPVATAGFGVLRRSGVAGVGQELATYVPLHVGPPPVGPLQLDIEAVLLRVENGLDTSMAVAPSVGASTPAELPWGAWARIGTSPFGFERGAYPVWHLGGRGRLGNPFAFGVETGRAPVLDSYASWVGAADTFTEEPFGQVHHTWLGGWAGLAAPWGTDVGVLGRLGQSEGLGLTPVGRAEVVAWVGQRIGSPERNVRIGGEGVAFSYQYQVDGFQSGQGAFYSPPIFGVATGRLDVHWSAFKDRLSVCGGVGAGMQYAGGGPSPYFAPGSTFTHNGRFNVEWTVSGDWGIGVQGGWLQAGTWHQETGLLRFGHNLGGPPPLTTFATPSAGLVYQGGPC